MVEVLKHGVYLLKGQLLVEDVGTPSLGDINNRLAKNGIQPLSVSALEPDQARANTVAYKILTGHNQSGDWRRMKLNFDALAAHDITYVGIIQTACASGMKEFPVPFVLTNCHNSLCAVGGTINEDDHVFGLSAARKYGGIFVPAHQAVIHQYMREMMAGCGKMLLASDSHTRYGALGTMGFGEGGPEIVKQLLCKTYDMTYPEVVAVYLEGRPAPGVGPQDVALAIIGAVYKSGFVKNKILEFVGPGIANLTVDFRSGVDVMTTETTCLSSIWCTDDKVREYYRIHGRPEDYRPLAPGEVSYYDGLVKVDLSKVEPMIALPFHPSEVWTIAELNRNAADILRSVEAEGQKQMENPAVKFNLSDKLVNGRLKVDQGVVAGCAGGSFENVAAMARILETHALGDFSLNIYPASQPVFLELLRHRAIEKLTLSGASIRSAFCGPCFGAGDTPANGWLSIRHTTRNFPNREGSKPADGQIASVALMDARSIAATAINGGLLTPATDLDLQFDSPDYHFNRLVYDNKVYQGFGKAEPQAQLVFGPNIASWPEMAPLPENLLLVVSSVIRDPVTTTDELIPSGETSSYRSNPIKLAEFTLSRKDPGYVARAKAVQKLEADRQQYLDHGQFTQELREIFRRVGPDGGAFDQLAKDTGLGSVIFAVRPGDGSAREQAASCQKVLGGQANIAVEYATKRYRSNLVNWGMLPFTVAEEVQAMLNVSDLVFVPGIRAAVKSGAETVTGFIISLSGKLPVTLKLQGLSPEEREIILAGCLINYYAS